MGSLQYQLLEERLLLASDLSGDFESHGWKPEVVGGGLAVFKRKHPRPKLSPVDRLFWTILRRIWSGWGEALIIVKPDTVVRWHRTGFRLYSKRNGWERNRSNDEVTSCGI